jgi:hypothetical protein
VRERRVQQRHRALQVAHAERDQRVLGEALQRLKGGDEALVERDGALECRRADRHRLGEVRRRLGERLHAGLQLAEERLAVGQERTLLREVLDPLVERRRAAGDRVLDERPRDVGQRAEGDVQIAEQLGLLHRDRRHLAGRPAQRGHEPPQARRRIGQVAHHRRERHQQRVEVLDGAVEVRPAPGERVAELEEVALLRGARAVVERAQDLVDLDRLGPRAAQRDRRAVVEALARRPSRDLHVLEPERRARADEHGGVDRQRLDRPLHLQRQRRGDRAVGVLLWLDVRHRADARAADADVVAPNEVGCVGDLGLELVRRHERQAGVRVVGQEHGDDDDERRRRADEHGVGRDRARSAAPHQPPPPSR